METIFLFSLLLGLIVGLLAGLFGIGGGLVIVPALAMLFSYQHYPAEQVLLLAVATSLATIILTAISSIYAHHRLGAVIWSFVWRLSPLIMLGAMLGAAIAEKMPTQLLRYVLVLFLLYVGTVMALQIKTKASTTNTAPVFDYATALFIGLMSAIVGIGGGTLTVPYLIRRHVSMHSAVAIASACGLPIALAGTLSYGVLAWHTPNLPEGCWGYVSLPAFLGITSTSLLTAPLGAKLAHRLPAAQLKRYFSVLLFIMAAKLAWH
jgi:uncharacterized membrane protein YfcA